MPSFQEVLSAAIEDITVHGFDEIERIEKWKRALQQAANESLISSVSLEQKLRDGLALVYKKAIDQGGIFKHHPGVARFTIEKIKPQLRSELDRRIAASASLIKLNREEAIAKTLRRFEGWSTSIPPGGVSAEKRNEVKANTKKALKQLPFEERRVLIDQGHKLISAINEIVAADGGAIAGRWRSNYRQPGYNYREDHKERDNHVYLIRDSWAHKAGLVKKNKDGYYDEIDAVGQAPFCRCYMIWIYSLRELPDDMLTKEGRRKTVEIGMHLNATRALARTDSVDLPGPVDHAMMREAAAADRLDFLRGLKRVRVIPDHDQWHGETDKGVITLEAKFEDLAPLEQLHVFMHEVGHVGQDTAPAVYKAFRRKHGARLADFVAMANPTHLQDFERTGEVDSGLGPEVFAESYARFCLGLELPADLAEFWRGQITGLETQADAKYLPWWPNRITRCARCSMFEAGIDPRHNRCSAVQGDIAMHGHCRLFEIGNARADDADADRPPGVGYEAMRLRLERMRRELP